MKAYLFIETGEVRQPRHGECFINMMGNCIQHGDSDEDRVILTRHEIEIPDKATRLTVIPERFIEGGCYGHSYDPTRVPIPRPKKTVKKTVYLHVQNHNGRTVYSVHDGNTAPSEAYPVEIEVEE